MIGVPVYLFEGLVYEKPEGFFCQTSEGDASLTEIFEGNQGGVVAVTLHHLPPEPPLQVPGMGCCMWGDFCPLNHPSRPTWLFQQHVQGLLTVKDGKWSVGGELLDLRSLLGHRSRILLVRKMKNLPDGEIQELQNTADHLGEILSALQKHVREENG